MTSSAQASLFDRIGGMAAVNASVDVFYNMVIADPLVNYYFKYIDIKKRAGKLKGFLAYAFGAPMTYSGKSMQDAHRHMKITDEQFNR
jgi:hemoglobin